MVKSVAQQKKVDNHWSIQFPLKTRFLILEPELAMSKILAFYYRSHNCRLGEDDAASRTNNLNLDIADRDSAII